jgi:glycosyltransferase involved in cell wall biosynthesis
VEAVLEPSGPVHVVHHGVDLAHFTSREPTPGFDEQALDRLGIHDPYLAFLGTIEPRKNVPGLVRAFDRVAERHRSLRLVLAGGKGWGWPAAEEAIGAARHRDRIIVLGFVDDAAVPALLRRSAAVVYPSLEEGFGLPALEALACGAAVITTRGTSMEEVAGEAAVLVQPGDDDDLAAAIDATLSDEAAGADRRGRGLARAAEATWDVAARRYASIYAEVRDGHR